MTIHYMGKKITSTTKHRMKAGPVSIYVLIDPTNGKVFYVGSTCLSLSSTLSRHISHVNSQSPSKGKIIRKMVAKGLKPIIKAVCECSIADRYREENAWIQKLKKKYKLVNISMM